MSAGVSSLAVLLTSIAMTERAGAYLYVRDLALELQRLGHRPLLYTPLPGVVSEELVRAGVPVVVDARDLPERPDVIHGNHTVETALAAIRLPGVPAVFVCHGLGWMAEPPGVGAVQRWVAVGSATLERLRATAGVEPERCHLIPNGVDTQRFRPSGRPLPERPQRAAVFSNNATPGGFVDRIRHACDERGIDLDVLGAGAGRPVETPEDILPGYDLVFARGRCAREALACGCGVVLVDDEGLGRFVDASLVEGYDRAAFGAAVLTRPHDAELIGAEIDRYDPTRVAAASATLRRGSSLGRMSERLVEVYRLAIADHADHADHADAAADRSADLEWLLGYLPALSALGLERDEVLLARHLLHQHARHLEARLEEAERQAGQAHAALAEVHRTRWMQARDRLLAVPGLGAAARAAIRGRLAARRPVRGVVSGPRSTWPEGGGR